MSIFLLQCDVYININLTQERVMSFSEIFTPYLAEIGGANPNFTIVFYVLMFGALWFLLIAPQRKKQKEHTKMLQALTVGAEVVTAGGIFGTITNVKDDRFILKIADNTKIEISKASIQGTIQKEKK